MTAPLQLYTATTNTLDVTNIYMMILAYSIHQLWDSHGTFKWDLTQSSPRLVFSLTGHHGAAMDTEDCHGALAFVYALLAWIRPTAGR